MRMLAPKNLIAIFFSIIFAFSALAPAALAEEPSVKKTDAAATSEAKNGSKNQEVEEDERDYYTLRAQEMLKADGNDASAMPHPLAKNYPDHYVVVCTGGCKNRQAYIVDMQPHKPEGTVEIGEMIPTAAGGGSTAPGSNIVRCIGGCYDGKTIHMGSADVEDSWDSTVPPAPSADASESGRWMKEQD